MGDTDRVNNEADRSTYQGEPVGPRQSMPWGSTVIISWRMVISSVALKYFGQADLGSGALPSISLNRARILFLPLGMKSLPADG